MSVEAALSDRYRDARRRLNTPPPPPSLPVIPSEPFREIVAEVAERLTVAAVSASAAGRVPAIIRLVAERARISPAELVSQRLTRVCALARFTASYLIREYTPLSLTQIAKRMGGRDHTTILHSLRKTEQRLREDQAYAAEVASLRRVLDYVFNETDAL